MNIVTLIGNLATEVDVREPADGKKVASFLLAVQRQTKDDEADFVWVSAWDRQGEVCAEYLSKGRKVAVAGRLRSHSWEEDGKTRHKVEVVASRVQFLSPAPADDPRSVEVPFEAAAV